MMTSHPTPSRRLTGVLLLILAVWALAVVAGAQSGFLASLSPITTGAIVAATIVLPTLIYLASPRLQAYSDGIGQRRIMAFHIWRVPAALLFFWYGANGALPPAFWILAGTGDLIAGATAAYLLSQPPSPTRYLRFHLLGFADFVVAVGTGLTFSLLLDPRMAAITALPLALIPLFGVGISGVSHLVAFDMLRREKGPRQSGGGRPAIAA
jgi:hypothetical protein